MLNQENNDGGNQNKSEERSIQFVIAGKHHAKPLEFRSGDAPCKHANPPAMDSEQIGRAHV